MLRMPPPGTPLPAVPASAPSLPYEAPALGVNYWVRDGILPDAEAVAARCFDRQNWLYGYPHAPEKWPGMRFHGALTPDELAHIESWVREATGARKLWVETAPGGAKLDFNVAQLVGERECGPRPHTDSRDLSRYAAVIYLSPTPAADAGTSFYRLRYPNGAAGGNLVAAPHRNLVDALGVRSLPPQAWYEVERVDNVFNRMLLYKSNMVHSATRYFGEKARDRRLTAVFFWMADMAEALTPLL
ncbi:DUF6445 family protein [Chitinimonas koreensis]|uniref:DUF6445 family protein n=1 Tax=Chitinimonas koreensis TaxID=356302 RepID=UPI0004191781|nr:DUF6445 family protein [Chitinimonas koreensis]